MLEFEYSEMLYFDSQKFSEKT